MSKLGKFFKNVQMTVLETLHFPKLISRKILIEKTILEFSHCVLPIFFTYEELIAFTKLWTCCLPAILDPNERWSLKNTFLFVGKTSFSRPGLNQDQELLLIFVLIFCYLIMYLHFTLGGTNYEKIVFTKVSVLVWLVKPKFWLNLRNPIEKFGETITF